MMKKTITTILSVSIIAILGIALFDIAFAASTVVPSERTFFTGKAQGTTSPLFQLDEARFNTFRATSTTATSTIAGGLSITGGGLNIGSILNCTGSLQTSTTGVVICGAGVSGITSLGGLTGGTQTFSHPDGQNTTLTITSSGTDHEFKMIDSMSPVWENFMATSTTASSTVVNRFNVSGVLNASSTLLVGSGLTVYSGTVNFPDGSIANADLANSSVTINTAAPLGGGGAVSLGGTLNLTCTGCLTSAITTLNGLTGATQTFSTNDWLTVTSAGTDHKFQATTSPAFGFLTATSTTLLSKFYGPVTIDGTFTVANGEIGNAELANSTISGVALGGTLNALTAGTGLSAAGTYTGATARTFSLDATGDWTGTLDSIEGASFLRSDASDSYTSGTLTFDASTVLGLGAASLLIPNAANPTVTTLGYMALDTTNNELLMATSTTGGAVVYAKEIKQLYSFVLASTSPAFKNGETLPLPSKEQGFTVYYIQCNVWGGTSVASNLTDSTNNDATSVTCDTTTSTQRAVVTNNVFTTGEGTSLEIGAITGTPNYLLMSVWGIWARR